MKKLGLFSIAAAALLSVTAAPRNADAAAWSTPTNNRFVQLSNSSASAFSYPTIKAALDSIPTTGSYKPSATYRYTIKVLPGVYAQGVPLQMRSFVDIEGSGQENTVISSALSLDTDYYEALPVPTMATVVMAAHSRLSNLRVQNTSATSGIAILVTQPSATVENVTADASGAGDCANDWGGYYAVAIRDASAIDVVLRNVTATATWNNTCAPGIGRADCKAIIVDLGPKISVFDSKAIAKGGKWPNGIYCGGETCRIRDSYCEGGGVDPTWSREGYGLNGGGNIVENTIAYGHDAERCYGITGAQRVQHSEARAGGVCTTIAGLNGTSAAATLIEGGFSEAGRVTNCWDENLVPIVNFP